MDGHKLVQIRNPWANEVEWNGPWSDSSPEWTDRMKHKLKHVPQVLGFFLPWNPPFVFLSLLSLWAYEVDERSSISVSSCMKVCVISGHVTDL